MDEHANNHFFTKVIIYNQKTFWAERKVYTLNMKGDMQYLEKLIPLAGCDEESTFDSAATSFAVLVTHYLILDAISMWMEPWLRWVNNLNTDLKTRRIHTEYVYLTIKTSGELLPEEPTPLPSGKAKKHFSLFQTIFV